MLWIALHLPALPLETFLATLPAAVQAQPVALFDAQRQLLAANAAALALGLQPGHKRATALALAPALVQHTAGAADAARDAQALAAVAHVALAFTPSVTLPDAAGTQGHTVLLEVQPSLRRFGGPERSLPRLLEQLRAALAPLGHRVHLASAPTAQGAALLARLASPDRERHAADLAALRQQLAAAPVWLLGPGREHWEALQGMGLRTLGDLRQLPRAGLARRFGEGLLDELDRALGLRPDPRLWVTLPEVFEARLELFARADTTDQVLHGATLLLAPLLAWARAQQAQVRRFMLHMQHEKRHRHDVRTPDASMLDIALAEPSADAEHLRVLLRERLAHVQLVAPTLELRLHCADVAHRAPPNSELFPSAGSEREGLARLIERLQARLGSEGVQRLQPVADHRPERSGALRAVTAVAGGVGESGVNRNRGNASGVRLKPRAVASRAAPGSSTPATSATPAAPVAALPARKPLPLAEQARPAPPPAPAQAASPRPVWLLPEPLPLPERQSRPLLDGRPLQLLCGPERIESGWWDAALAERDYFIAQAHNGALVWVYRGRLPLSGRSSVQAQEQAQGWFLQGRFA